MGTVGPRTAARFETNERTDEVADYLRELGLATHVASSCGHAITGNMLMSLTGSELRDTLGVVKLKDRRVIMDATGYLTKHVNPM